MRIAHFSDLHLLSLDGARILDFANKRWIGGLNLLTNRGRHYQSHIFEALIEDLNASRVDHVICTGDVTNLALEQEFGFARELFDRIELGPKEVTVIPGNHDAYVAKGAEFFTGYFADYHDPDDDWAWDDGDLWPVVRVRGDVAIIGLSTSLETPWFTAYGVVGRKQLDRLAQVLDDDRLTGKVRIVAIHHPPAGSCSQSRIRGLHDRGDFRRVLARSGADLVIHGHEHQDLFHTLPGPGGKPIPVRGIQSGTYNGSKLYRGARYRVFEIGQGREDRANFGIRATVMRVFDADSGQFTADGGQQQAAA